MTDYCTSCLYEDYDGAEEPCINCVRANNKKPTEYIPKRPTKPMTNGDVIRSMSDYDLADWIAKVLTYHGSVVADEYHVDCNTDCPLYKCCNDQPTDNIEGWLKSPMEVSG